MNIYEKPEIQYIRFDALVPVMDAAATVEDPFAVMPASEAALSSVNLFSGETAEDDKYVSYGSAAFSDAQWN